MTIPGPDGRRIGPGDDCGHYVKASGSGFYCDAPDDGHTSHRAVVDGRASRGLGSVDDVKVKVTVTWEDSRPAATVGDYRALMARFEAEIHGG